MTTRMSVSTASATSRFELPGAFAENQARKAAFEVAISVSERVVTKGRSESAPLGSPLTPDVRMARMTGLFWPSVIVYETARSTALIGVSLLASSAAPMPARNRCTSNITRASPKPSLLPNSAYIVGRLTPTACAICPIRI